MLTRIFLLIVLLAVILAASALADTSPRMNPYLPTNAVAAEPPTPYNLNQLPKCSRTDYPPCPTCGPPAGLLPDLPPVSAPFPGHFYRPVPLP